MGGFLLCKKRTPTENTKLKSNKKNGKNCVLKKEKKRREDFDFERRKKSKNKKKGGGVRWQVLFQ